MGNYLGSFLRFLHTALWIGVIAAAVYTGYYFRTEKVAYDLLYSDPYHQSLGAEDAPIVIVEVMDFRCPHCREMENTVREVLAKNPDVRIIYKYMPVYGELSMNDVRLALAAGKLGKYPEMHDFLMTQDETLDDSAVLQRLQGMGLDVAEVQKLIASDEIINAAVKPMAAAARLGIKTVPVFIHGKTIYSQFETKPTYEDFENLLKQIRAASKPKKS